MIDGDVADRRRVDPVRAAVGDVYVIETHHPDDRAFDVPTTKLPKVTDADDEVPEIEAKDLIERIIASGGTLTISDPSSGERAAWRRAIHAAARGELPDGMELKHSGRVAGDLRRAFGVRFELRVPTLSPNGGSARCGPSALTGR